MTKDLTSGSPLKLILGFAFPVFLGMLFQQFYNMVDTMIVGKFLGVEALAGVGSTSSLNFMVIGFCMGICNGFAIPIAQKFGARQEEELRRFVANCAWLCVLTAVVLTLTVTILCSRILHLMDTPENIFGYAYQYIFIIFCGIPFTILYNMLAAIIQSLGDSRTPVVFLAISSAINIVLDIVFIVVFGMSVEGPALATVIAQAVSGAICFFYMKKKYTVLRIRREEWKLRRAYIGRLCYMGIPMGLQYSVTAIGSLIIQAAINGFGSTVVAGVTAAQRIESFLSCPVEALGATMAPYSGQNMGAGKIERIGQGTKTASLCGFVASAVLLLAAIVFGKSLIMLFLDAPDEEVIRYAYQFLVTTSCGYCLLTLVNVVRFTIQGMGFSVLAITSGVMEMIARTLVGLVVVPMIGFTGICLAHVTAWIFADAFLIPAFFYCRKKVSAK
jgi:putative MATE family efflux protein